MDGVRHTDVMKILVLVPARGGSKGLPGKNLLRVAGMSLVGRAVRVGKRFLAASGHDGTVLVDTDSEEIAAEGRRWGALAPFLRPAALAGDETPMIDNVLHAMERIASDRGEHDVVVLLQPTSPLREVEDVLGCFRAFERDAGSVISIVRADHPPQQALRLASDGELSWQWPELAPDARRQDLAPMWRPSGAVYVSSAESLRRSRAFIVPGRTRGVPMPGHRAVDVDGAEDLAYAEAVAGNAGVAPVPIGMSAIGDGRPTFVIAEAGVNHNGDVKIAHRLIDAAAHAKADAVKFQTFEPSKLVSRQAAMAAYQIENTGQRRTQKEMLAELVLPRQAHYELRDHANDLGIQFLSSPFDEASADFLEELGVPAFKLGSGELTNHPLLAHVGRTGKPLLISTGMADLVETDAALEVVRATGNTGVVLLHCVTSYPAAAADANLRAIRTLRAALGVPAGFSDHTLGLHVALAAVALGAAVIEKHFTLDRSMPGPDHKASLDPSSLLDLVSSIRALESAFGDGLKVPKPVELPLVVAARKSLHAARDLPIGHVLERADLIALRPGDGISPAELSRVIGRKLVRPLAEGAQLAEDQLG
jgi:N,N'-diacetyllegionaminate synthase